MLTGLDLRVGPYLGVPECRAGGCTEPEANNDTSIRIREISKKNRRLNIFRMVLYGLVRVSLDRNSVNTDEVSSSSYGFVCHFSELFRSVAKKKKKVVQQFNVLSFHRNSDTRFWSMESSPGF